nr:hypothetical protein [Kofleriaceae bacterium]
MAVVLACAARVAAADSTWFHTVVDRASDDHDDRLQAFARSTGELAILARMGPTFHVEWLRGNAGAWTREVASMDDVVAALDDTVPWFVTRDDGGVLHLRHGKLDQRIGDGNDPLPYVRLARDAHGDVHACIATSQDGWDARLELAYAHATRGAWKIEPLPIHGHGCAIAIAADGAVVVGGDDGVARGHAGAWQVESLGGRTRVARAADGTVVAAIASKAQLSFARLDASGAWRTTAQVVAAGETIERLVLTLDGTGAAHVALWTGDSATANIRYAREGDATAALVAAADAGTGLAIAVDAAGQPSIVYSDEIGSANLVVARPRTSTDPAGDARDDRGGLAGCAAVVDDAIGLELGPGDTGQLARDIAGRTCTVVSPQLAAMDLDRMCRDGNLTAACAVLAAMLDGKRQLLLDIESRHFTCDKSSCTTTQREETEPSYLMPVLPADHDRAHALWQHACDLGDAAACFAAVWVSDADFGTLAKTCTAALPIACAAAVAAAPGNLAAAAAKPVRAALATACKTSEHGYACGSLADLEDAGLGGGRDAGAAAVHRTRACLLGEGGACAQLELARRPAPRGLDPGALDHSLATRCDEHDEDACRARADAYARGWGGITRDADQAAQIKQDACNSGVSELCSK